MFELLPVSIAAVLAKGITRTSTKYPSINYPFWSLIVIVVIIIVIVVIVVIVVIT